MVANENRLILRVRTTWSLISGQSTFPSHFQELDCRYRQVVLELKYIGTEKNRRNPNSPEQEAEKTGGKPAEKNVDDTSDDRNDLKVEKKVFQKLHKCCQIIKT